MSYKTFYSKILLFGEYSIIKNSKALAIPFGLFSGQLKFWDNGVISRKIKNSNRELKAFSEYIELQQQKAPSLFEYFDVDSFQFDIRQGLYFESTIPQGFGVGSSGALVAALIDNYYHFPKNNLSKEKQILALKKLFGAFEAHFHGSSSGADPLICYLNKSLLFHNKEEIDVVQLPEKVEESFSVFLIDTERPRRTEPLVNLFLEKCKNKTFDNLIDSKLKPLTDHCIDHFLAGNTEELFTNLHQLSAFQYEYFRPMIPTLYRKLWKQGIEEKQFSLKLCGAGGGGFILGLTKNKKTVKSIFKGYRIRFVQDF